MKNKMIKNGKVRSLNKFYLDNFEKMVFDLGEKKTAEIIKGNKWTINYILDLNEYEQVPINMIPILERIVIYIEENMDQEDTNE